MRQVKLDAHIIWAEGQIIWITHLCFRRGLICLWWGD